MKISIESNGELKESFLIDLFDKKVFFQSGEKLTLLDGWYELNLLYTGRRIGIIDIKINNESIKRALHTAYYLDDNRGRNWGQHQPASAMSDNSGTMKIWLHTNLGVFFQRIFGEIDSGDSGNDLNEKYVFTVDRSLKLQKQFPESISKFFIHGDGPHWWKLGTDYTPYRILDLDAPPQEKIIEECNKICVYEKKSFNSVMVFKTICKGHTDLPFKEVDWESAPNLKKLLLQQVGYTNIIDISMQTLKPNSHIHLHRDDHYTNKRYRITRGCKKMYWPLSGDWSKNYLKLGKSGIVPFNNRPCLINTLEHVHTAVNESDEPRTTLVVYGDLPDDK